MVLLTTAAIVTTMVCARHERTVHPPGSISEREIINTDAAPAVIGPYSQAVEVGDTLYLSGQIGLDPATGEMVAGGVVPEIHQVLANARAVLEAAGFTPADVVQSIVFLADMDDYGAVNEIYSEFFRGEAPARAAVQVARLPKDARVEIMMTAVRAAEQEAP
jgi:2-iminobutanoate/2-iminopropanoate deaminase